jgi:hypothetical protein
MHPHAVAQMGCGESMKVTGAFPLFLDEHQFAAAIERWDSLVAATQESEESNSDFHLRYMKLKMFAGVMG